MGEAPERKLKCLTCDEYLVPAKTLLMYLGHQLSYELPRCPVCGQAFVSEELAKGKMQEVEMALEDK